MKSMHEAGNLKGQRPQSQCNSLYVAMLRGPVFTETWLLQVAWSGQTPIPKF